MKKSLIMVIALLALSSLMAAMAFSSAQINNDGTLTVSSTNDSLISLTPYDGVGNKDGAAYIDRGVLKIDMSKGNGGNFGVQRDSFYKWDNLFVVKNNSKETVEFNITKDGWGYNTKVNIYLGAFDPDGVKKEFIWRSNSKSSNKVTLEPGEQSVVYLHLETESGADIRARDAKLMVNVTAK